jgi:hypothetical protein
MSKAKNMQDKFELSNKLLPLEIYHEIEQRFSNSALLNFALTSRGHLTLFQPMLDARRFLPYVVRGEHETVKAMLEKKIDLIHIRGKVTDCSGRTFNNISPFEYALWALDKHMWELMLECIAKNEKGNEVLQILSGQYKNLSTRGVTYTLHWETITENHFDFKNTIINKLQTQVDSMNAANKKNWDDIDWDDIDTHWRKGVGGAQKLLPMHVVYEYCSEEPFFPLPKFTTRPKSSKQLYNWQTEKYENWLARYSSAETEFSIYRGAWVSPRVVVVGCARKWGSVFRMLVFQQAGHDLVAVKALCEVRTEDFLNLKSRLEKQMTLDNHHQVFQI